MKKNLKKKCQKSDENYDRKNMSIRKKIAKNQKLQSFKLQNIPILPCK